MALFVSGSTTFGTILASLPVRTTVGLFHVGGQGLGVMDASGTLLFLLVVLVSEAQETAEVTHTQ